MEFEWDENKRLANLEKHGIDFTVALLVFEDENRINYVDDRKSYGETRIRTVGKIKNELIVSVINTDRNNKIRIISARRANQKEREDYYGNS